MRPSGLHATSWEGAVELMVYQPPYPGANPDEVAEIIVAGGAIKRVAPRAQAGAPVAGSPLGTGSFSDWETVWVQHRWRDAWPIFRFTAVEREPYADLWQKLQIIPTDRVQIMLGGELAITGVVTVRQTAYDGNSHAVSIQGVGIQWYVWRGAILDKDQNFPGGYMDVVNKVLKPFQKKGVEVGTINGLIFKPPVHNEIGETVFQLLEKTGRMRKVVLGADHKGELLFVGEHDSVVVDTLDEGDNIISCQCVISIDGLYDPIGARGQTQRSDPETPPKAAQQDAYVRGSVGAYSPLLVANEHPVWTEAELKVRAETEARWTEGSKIEVTVVVYGWFTRKHVLWAQLVGQSVILNSPMTTLVGEKLSIESATCTQDRQSGTRTTLVLVAPWLLNDKGIRLPNSQIDADPGTSGTAQSNPNTPAVTGDPDPGGAG